MEWLLLLEKGAWAGFAAIGFAVLFNVPKRTLFIIWCLGFIGGFTKFTSLSYDINIIIASLLGASFIGVLSIPMSHRLHTPPMIFSIPAVIPMVPGAFAYRMMLDFLQIATSSGGEEMPMLLVDTFQNMLKAVFILLSLAVGVAVPMLITRKESAKRIRIKLS